MHNFYIIALLKVWALKFKGNFKIVQNYQKLLTKDDLFWPYANNEGKT